MLVIIWEAQKWFLVESMQKFESDSFTLLPSSDVSPSDSSEFRNQDFILGPWPIKHVSEHL